MKRILLISVLALLVVTGGMFAYTFTTATATIGVAAPTSDFANVTANTTTPPDYVFGSFTGTWPQQTLFTIEPHDEYTGDLVITVSLVNTGELIRQYRHLNMALQYYDANGDPADTQGEIQVLNLQNAEVLFDWQADNGTAPFSVNITTGGSFRLHPFRDMTGGSYQPMIWCEVTQR
ncbi:MAG: hypothetical protein HQ577_04550 [Dehalococcoidia bacterium]|nr:hypothetical protein [Dehalococcoidia bacterium]